MKVYIAAPYPERLLALATMKMMQARGHEVTSRWLTDEDHVLLSQEQNAINDLEDVRAADVLLALNPLGYENKGTGGRHGKFLYAHAHNKIVVLVGERTMVFHHLPEVYWFQNPVYFEANLSMLEDMTRKRRASDQPLPMTNDLPRCHDLQIDSLSDMLQHDSPLLKRMKDDILRRLAIGIQRYGTPLQPFNKRSFLRDLYEELLDAGAYAQGVLYEAQRTSPPSMHAMGMNAAFRHCEDITALTVAVRRALDTEEAQRAERS
jgi:hypothetical protein